MGQYYRAFNLTKKKIISSHDTKMPDDEWGSGSKLLEHSYKGNPFVGAVCELLKSDWRGDRIAWIGDYHESGEVGDIPTWEEADAQGYEETVVPGAINVKGFLNNQSKNISIDMSKLTFTEGEEEEDGWELHPLSLLTACGNNRGGGDYTADDRMRDEIIGTWAGDKFSFTDEPECPVVPFDEDLNNNALKFIKSE